ncbi:MAG: hypothetical protein ABH844_02080 [Candidatus Omnitrophota bacterium]
MKITNNKGAILLIAAFIITLAAILVVGFLEVAVTDIEIARNQKSDIITTYIADAGVGAAIYNLRNSGDGNISRTEFPDTAENNTYYTTVQMSKNGNIYTIQSTGEFGNFQRVLEAKIKITGSVATLQYWKEV